MIFGNIAAISGWFINNNDNNKRNMNKEQIEEIKERLMKLIREGHETVINKEEVEEYNKKVEDFIISEITKALEEQRRKIRKDIINNMRYSETLGRMIIDESDIKEII